MVVEMVKEQILIWKYKNNMRTTRQYSPDRWVIVEINSEKYGKIRKILAGWYSGFAGSDSWKLSSGICTFEDKGDFYDSLQESGSSYRLYKASEGFTGLTGGLFKHWRLQVQEQGCTIQQVDVKSTSVGSKEKESV